MDLISKTQILEEGMVKCLKNIYWSCNGPAFYPQYWHGDPQSSIL